VHGGLMELNHLHRIQVADLDEFVMKKWQGSAGVVTG
jgi:hypothetical protein